MPRFDSDKNSEFESLERELSVLLPKLSKHELEALTSEVRLEYMKRFGRHAAPKYGSLNKGFNEQELQRFFRVIDSDKFRLVFSYQAQLGLRIGEVVRLSVKDINFQTRELKVFTEKARVLDMLIIPVPLFKQTVDFVNKNTELIEEAKGYIFFKDEHGNKAGLFLDPNYVRNKFRHYLSLAGLDETYDVSEERCPNRRARKLHRLTTHSLRHHAITTFAKQTNGNVVLASRFARHSDPSTTMTYINTNKEELYREIDSAFSVSNAASLKERLKNFS